MRALALWLFYILGGALSMWKRANLSANSPHTPWSNVRGYVEVHLPQLGMNFVLSTGLFWVWWHEPAFVANMIGHFGIQTDIAIPLNLFTAGCYGVVSDQAMDFFVAKVLARLNPPMVATDK
jgi:hypothetical protein